MGRVTASLGDLPLRDDLRGLTPYGAPQAPLPVALNVNENTHPVPDEVASDILDDIAVALREVNRYPDREFTTLREAFAEYLGHNLAPEQIWAGNGSNEVLQHIMQAFGGPNRTVFGFAPTYSMYPLIAQGTGAQWVAGQREADYTITPDEAAAQVRQAAPDIVMLCSPNNPTGTPLDLDVVEAVYEATSGIVVVDEAYQEFAPRDAVSALTLLEGRPRLAVSRTMSKAFAFAGARVGYLAADPAFIDALRLVRLPYHLSALTQAAAVAALRNADIMLGMVDEIVEQRDRITATLEALDYQPHESWSNFVLFGGVPDPRATFEALYERGVLVRDVGIPNHLRVTAGTEAETTAFLDALASIDSGS
ncbi:MULTISPECIES: histidinol-phosphate transaminase [unclassified Microbacterium]|uniref:histidinol-phosphate transaminase n=1 Tax=unclassified Microbacterium TaxID=2609290 RepID=UPI001D7796EE|nr:MULTISPECIES: histidinol-phosphate transaminase [unclassified Microbacterium]CAH0206511.1 Histidinol-phosphate aminotransferase [Microbacterium sp. Bi121]HWK78906.1 histidinol-phosphate transaminase [Microbacterium sp.]